MAYIPASKYIDPLLIDAKGDLITGTADNAVGRLGIGTNDYILTADSAQSSGMKWAAAGGATGTAGGDLAGTYPDPTLAEDRVRKTGDTMSGELTVTVADDDTNLRITANPDGWAAALVIDGQAASSSIWFRGNGLPKYNLISDSGGIFRLAYNDPVTGYLGGYALNLTPTDGLLTVKGDPTANLGIATKQYADKKVLKTGDTMTGQLAISPAAGVAEIALTSVDSQSNFTANIGVGQQGGLLLNSGTTPRWQIVKTAGAEPGSNAGSNLRINSFTDAGGLWGTPLTIYRDSNEVRVVVDPTATFGVATKQYVDRMANPPSTNNLISWTCDPMHVSQTKILSAGVIQLIQLKVPPYTTITNIHTHLVTAGATLTASQCWAGLYNSSGTQLGLTATTNSTWSAIAGLKTIPLTTPWTSSFSTVVSVYVALVANGTTMPTFSKPVGSSTLTINAGLTAATSRAGTYGSAQTTLPANITMSSITPTADVIWVGLS